MADDDLTPEEHAHIKEQDRQLEEIKRRIDGELRISRPDRYEPGHSFLDDVAERVAEEVPATIARQMLARDLVGQREGAATKRTNKFLKGIVGADGQFALPVDWMYHVDDPVAINVPVTDEGEVVRYRRERVALRAMRSQDWMNFASIGRVDLQHRFEAEMVMYDGAEWLAAEQGASPFKEWAEVVMPIPDEDVA